MNRIVALIDFSEVTPSVIKVAKDMARAFSCELLLLHVVVSQSEFPDTDPAAPQAEQPSENRTHRRQLEILRISLAKEGINTIAQIARTDRPQDNPVEKILQEMARLSPDIVVIGSHGHGRLHQLLAGSVTDRVLRGTKCPVMIVPSRMSVKDSC